MGLVSGSGDEDRAEVKEFIRKSPPTKADMCDRTIRMDSGCRAWMVCFASFWTNGTIFGIINSTGILFVQLKKMHNDEDNVNVLTSIVGSLCIGITFLLSPIAGILTDKFGVRKVALVGSVIATIGMFLSSFVDILEVYYLTFGILFGAGSSLAYTPSLVILGHYFNKHIGLVNGIVTFGSSIFTVVLPFLLHHLFQTIGLPNTLRILSLMLALLVGCSLVFKPQLPVPLPVEQPVYIHQGWQDKCRLFCTKLINVNLWKNKRYRIWALTIPVALFGYFVPYIHLVQFSEETFPENKDKGFILVSCMGITSGVGRIFFGRLADFPRVNRIFLQQLSFFCIGVLTIIVPFAGYFEVLIALCLGLGLFDGCFISLLGPIAIDLTGRQGASQAIGFLLGMCSIPLTLGPPIASWIRDLTGSYQAAFIYAGIPPIIGSIVMIFVTRVEMDGPLERVLSVPSPTAPPMDESTYLTSEKELPSEKIGKNDCDVAMDPLIRNPCTVIIEPRKSNY